MTIQLTCVGGSKNQVAKLELRKIEGGTGVKLTVYCGARVKLTVYCGARVKLTVESGY